MEDKNTLGTTLNGGLNSAPVGGPVAPPTPPVIISPKKPGRGKLILVIAVSVVLALLVLGLAWLAIISNVQSTANRKFNDTKLDLIDLTASEFSDNEELSIIGQLNIDGGFAIQPTTQPSAARAGQIYFDQNTKFLNYYNGSEYVQVGSNLNVGTGITNVDNVIINSGVISLQGSTGDITLTAGDGISITGTTISTDGSGFTGTGTVGAIVKFTGAQTLADSLLTESGTTVTVGGSLTVTGGLSLTTALGVSSGGTGASSLTANGVLIGNGSSAVSSVTASGTGLCLQSTAGAPAFASCPGAGGVSSLNGLSGTLTLANAGGSGTTVTIDNASTTAKGISSFSATNFSVTSGAVNTIQNIDTGASPTFVGITLSGDLAVNGTDVTTTGGLLTIQAAGSTTIGRLQIGVGGAGSATPDYFALDVKSTTGDPAGGAEGYMYYNTFDNKFRCYQDSAWADCVGAGGGNVTSLEGLTGALVIDNATGAGSTITIDNATTAAKGIASFNATNFTVTAGAVNLVQNIDTAASPTFVGLTLTGDAAVNGGDITSTGALNITPSGALTLGVTGQGATLQGSTTSITSTGAGNDITINSADTIELTDSTNITGNLDVSGTLNVGTANALQVAATGAIVSASNATLQGGNVTVGTTSVAGNLLLSDGSSHTGTIQTASLGQDTVYILPDSGGASTTLCHTGGNCAGTGTGVTTAGGSTNRLAKFTASQAVNDSTITDNGTNVTTTIDIIVQGGDATIGTTAQQGSLILHDGNGETATLRIANTLAANSVISFPASVGTSDTVCLLTLANCTGSGTGSTLQAAYDAGNAITTAAARDIALTLGNNSNLTVATAASATGFSTFSLTDGSNATPPAQLVLVRNNDTNQAVAAGLKVTSATGTITTALDASGSNITNALSIGSNAISGTFFGVSSAGAVTAVGVNSGAGLLQGALGLTVTGAAVSLNTSSNFATNINTGTSNTLVSIGGGSGTFALDTTTIDISGGAITGATGITMASGNFLQNGTGTFGTGTGAVSLNGDTAVAATKTLTVTSGLTSLTGNTTGDTLNVSNSTSTGNIALFKDNSTTVLTVADGGATTFQNSTNSTSGFRVMTSAGAELAGIDTTDSIARLLANNTGHLSGTGTNWNTTTSIGTALCCSQTVTLNGYIYSIGGDNGGGKVTTVSYARIAKDGSLGSWTTTTALPVASASMGATVYNGYIYVHGGTGSAASSQDIYYAKPNADGTITGWTTQDNPTNLIDHENAGMTAYNGYLYIAGGQQVNTTELRNVYYGRIQADGSVPTFTVMTNWLPAGAHNPGSTVVANGYLYVFGSSNYDKFFYGRIAADGSVAAQTQATGTTDARRYTSVAVLNGYMYTIAGGTNGSATIQYGALASNGDIAAFTTDTTTLPAARSLCSWNAAVLNNYVYVVGCGDGDFAPQTTVYYASGSRVKVGGSLDLVGYSGEGMSEGGSGGQLSAGNTYINGILSVTGNATFKDGVGITQGLNVLGGVSQTGAAVTFNASSNFATSINTGTSNGTITLGGGSAPLVIDSTAFDVSVGGAVTAVGVNSGAGLLQGVLGLTITGAAVSLNASSNFATNINTGTSNTLVSIGGGSGTFALDTSNIDISGGAITGATGITMASGNFSQSGAGTFGTGTGAISLNGDTAVAATKTLTVTSGLTSLTGNTTGDALNVSNSTSTGNIALFKDNSTNVFTLADGGGATFLASTNAANTFQVQNSSALDFIDVNTTTSVVTIGNTTSSTAVTVDSGTGTIAVGTGAQARTINVGTGGAVQTVTLGSTNGASALTLNAGSGNAVLNATSGTVTIQTTTGGQILIKPVSADGTNIVLGTSDTVGTLLVLDDKTGSGDPTGVNGGMYYNSNRKSFRCYEGGIWFNCRESSKSSFRYSTEILSGTDEPPFGTYTEASGTNAYQTAIANHAGYLQHETDASDTGGAAIGISSNDDWVVFGNGDTWRYDTLIRIPTLSTGTQTFTLRIGFHDGNTFADPTDGCMFRYTDGTNSGEWQGHCADAGSSTCDTNVAPVANEWVRLTIVVNSDGTSADFMINGASTCQVTSQIPDTNGNSTGASQTIRKSVGTTERTMHTDYIEITADMTRPVPN